MIKIDDNFIIRYEGTSLELLRANNGSLERENNMSFCCFMRNKSGVVLCSDSREVFDNGKIDDNKQKIFITQNRQFIFAYTGIIHYNEIDYTQEVNKVMNKESLSIVDKLIRISEVMKTVTSEIFQKKNSDQRFDMFVVDTSSLMLYILSVQNGVLVDDTIADNYPTVQTMGGHVYLFHYYSLREYENDSIEDLQSKAVFLTKKAALRESLEKVPTINENVKWISVDIYGNIKSHI